MEEGKKGAIFPNCRDIILLFGWVAFLASLCDYVVWIKIVPQEFQLMFLTTCGLKEGFTQLDEVGRLTCLSSVCALCMLRFIVRLQWLKIVSFKPSN